jgi:hypothetical protein
MGRWARGALVALSIAVCVMMLWWPLGYDQGVFAFLGDVVVRGGTPYVDAFESRGPLSFYFTAAIQLLFGRNAWGVRVVDVAFALLTAWLLRRRLSTLTTPNVALVAAAAWPVLVASLTYHHSAQFDLWIGTAMLGCVLLVTRPEGYRTRDLVAAGALVGLASLTKPFYPAFLAVPGIAVLFHRRSDVRAAAVDIVWLVLGWLAPIVPMMAWLWAQGALREAWEVHIMFNLRVYAPGIAFAGVQAASPMALRVQGLWRFVSDPVVAVAFGPMLAGLVVLWRRQRALAAVLVTWVLIGTGFVLLQNKFFMYHWMPIYPALVLLCAVGLHALWPAPVEGRTAPGAVMVVASTVLLVVLVARRPEAELRLWASLVTGRISAGDYRDRVVGDGLVLPTEQQAVASYIRTHTRADEPFAHWSSDAALPFVADRPHTSRFYSKLLFTRFAPSPVLEAYRQEYLERIRTLRPTYIVVGTRGDLPDSTISRDAMERAAPELAALVVERYALETRIGETAVYRRRETAPAPAPRSAAAVP